MPLNVQYPAGLEDILGWGGIFAGKRFDEAQRNNQINQQSALQEMFERKEKLGLEQQKNQREQQQLPVDLDYKRALTSQTNQYAQGQQFKNEMDTRTKEETYRARVSEYAKKLSDDDLELAKNQIRKFALERPDQAEKLMSGFEDIVKERNRQRMMHDREMELAQLRAEETRATNAAKPAGAAGAPGKMTESNFRALQMQKAAAGDEEAKQWLIMDQARKERLRAAGAMITDERVRELLFGGDDGNIPIGKPVPEETLKPKPKTDSTTKYEKGKQYTGRTGTYEYLGGPEADPKSWKKIK